MVAHQITRGLSRVSIREKKSGTSRQEKLYIKERELRQDLKDKEFQLKCIQELIFSEISNEVRHFFDCKDHLTGGSFEISTKDFFIQFLIFTVLLFIKKILDWCETHGQFVGLRVRRYRETDL